ncbi:hypothetical protein V2J09_000686 [Rumex salicifolius]
MGEEVIAMEEAEVLDSQLVNYVRKALIDAAEGNCDDYNQLAGILHHIKHLSPDDVALLVTSLKALSGAVSHIDDMHHETLLDTISKMSMWNYGPDVMDALMELIISLAATNGKHVDRCLGMLVNNFIPPVFYLEALKTPRGVTKKEQVLERVHFALNQIAHLVPLSPARLYPIIRIHNPDFRKQEAMLVNYAENILKLESSSIGQLVGNSMLIKLVVDRLIDLDLELGWDVILSDDPTKGIFEMELEGEDLADSEDDEVEFHREYLTGDIVADKLDSLMVLTFEYLKSSFDNGRLVEVFESLLQSFQTTILNAYKSKFAQFVMFYACSLDPENCGVRFAQYLAGVYTSEHFPLLTRMSAIAYLGSYMARAKFLTASCITNMLERLAIWCSEYCQLHNGGVDPKDHRARAFYAGCQAIMYVLCFRMRSIIEVPRLKSQLQLIPLGQILKNSLDPFKVCLPSIVNEFAHQAKAAHLLEKAGEFVFNDVLESELSKAYGGIERLDVFFPFDPCLVQRSDGYIKPNYISWKMVKPTYKEDDNNSSEEEDEEDEEEDDFDNFNDSLNKMSITPRETSLMKFAKMPSKIRPSTSPESL